MGNGRCRFRTTFSSLYTFGGSAASRRDLRSRIVRAWSAMVVLARSRAAVVVVRVAWVVARVVWRVVRAVCVRVEGPLGEDVAGGEVVVVGAS